MRKWLRKRANIEARAAAEELGFARSMLPEFHPRTIDAYERYTKAVDRVSRYAQG